MSIHNGHYDSTPIERVIGEKKVVDVRKHYLPDRLCPRYETFLEQPLFIMAADV